MAWKVVKLVLDSSAPRSMAEKLFLICLADVSDDAGQVRHQHLSLNEIAEKCCMTQRTAIFVQQRLEKAGILTVERRTARNWRNSYCIVLEALRGEGTCPGHGETASPRRGTPRCNHGETDSVSWCSHGESASPPFNGKTVNKTQHTPNARGRAEDQSLKDDEKEPLVPSLILSALQKLSAALGVDDPHAFAGELARELPDLADKRLRIFAAGAIGEFRELEDMRSPDGQVSVRELASEIRRRAIEAMEGAMGSSIQKPGSSR